MMNPIQFCPRCSAALPSNGALNGLCPACILRRDLERSPMAPGSPQDAGASEMVQGSGGPPLADIQRDFPQLEIFELIGRGGMGLVYRARQRRLDRLVALKILSPELARDSFFAERFLREAQALAKLSHPNVVAVHDFGERHGRYFLLMEYVDGHSLRELLNRGRRKPAEALSLVRELCSGLQYAHGQGVVHRDIKPENILIDSAGRAKIVDFGLVKLLDRDEGHWRLTRASQVLGTPQYMAPEQMSRPEEVDHRADIFSLGVVLYELLTGDLPIGRYPLPSELAPVSRRVDDMLLRTMERDPDRRFQSAKELGAQLERLAESPAISASGPTSEAWPAQHRIAFLNYVDIWGGLILLNGIVFLDSDALRLEYRTVDCLGLRPSEVVQLRIPYEELSRIEFKRHWVGYQQITLFGCNLSFCDAFPQFQPGKIRLHFRGKETKDARQLSNCLKDQVAAVWKS